MPRGDAHVGPGHAERLCNEVDDGLIRPSTGRRGSHMAADALPPLIVACWKRSSFSARCDIERYGDTASGLRYSIGVGFHTAYLEKCPALTSGDHRRYVADPHPIVLCRACLSRTRVVRGSCPDDSSGDHPGPGCAISALYYLSSEDKIARDTTPGLPHKNLRRSRRACLMITTSGKIARVPQTETSRTSRGRSIDPGDLVRVRRNPPGSPVQPRLRYAEDGCRPPGGLLHDRCEVTGASGPPPSGAVASSRPPGYRRGRSGMGVLSHRTCAVRGLRR